MLQILTAYGGNNSIGSTNLLATPVPDFARTGYVDYSNGSLSSQGDEGFYWSSTPNDSTTAYVLNISSSGVNPASTFNRVNGYSVRCVVRE